MNAMTRANRTNMRHTAQRPILDTRSAVLGADAEASAIALAVDSARQSRQLARHSRQAAQRDRIDTLRRAADKLRDMADKTVASGVFRATLGFAGGIAKVAQAGLQYDAAVSKMPDAKLTKRAADMAGACGDVFNSIAAIDPFAMQIAHLRVSKRELETDAEVAGQRADDARDTASEAQRLEGSLKQQLQKLHELRDAATRAAVRA